MADESIAAEALPRWKMRRTPASPDQSMPVWRRSNARQHRGAKLRDLGSESRARAGSEFRIGDRLDDAERQVTQSVAEIEHIARAGATRVFGFGDARAAARASGLNEAQAELISDLVGARDRSLTPGARGAPGTRGGFLPEPVASLWKEFRAWVRRVEQLFSPTVMVETTPPTGGRALARTFVTASGDFHSVYGSLDRRARDRHREDVAEALHERNQALRSVAIAVGAAIKIALLLATPALALKEIIAAVWKFVREYLR